MFVTENGAGAAALLAIGAGFMVIAVLGDRVQSVELGGVNLTIRDLAVRPMRLRARPSTAVMMNRQRAPRTVASQLGALARGYRRLRGSMRAGAERTRALEHVMSEARRLAKSDVLEPVDVLTSFEEGSPEASITALGLMQGNPRLRDFEAALDAIDDSRSAFEQYHGLLLAEMMVSDLTPPSAPSWSSSQSARCAATG